MKEFAENRKARFDYDIKETVEAGLELRGFEVKSIRAGCMNITGAYAIIRDGEAWLLNAQIPPYQPLNTPGSYDPARSRRLLLSREEIKTLAGKLHEKYSLMALRVYPKKNLIKIELGVGRSRKKHDKREVLKKRSARREMREKN